MPREGRPRFVSLVPTWLAWHGFDKSLHRERHHDWAGLIAMAGLCVIGLGCRSDSAWTPTLPKFGSSNLVFGSRSNSDDTIEPPALSFRPGEGARPPGGPGATQIATNSGSTNSGSADSATMTSKSPLPPTGMPGGLTRPPYAYEASPGRDNSAESLATNNRSTTSGGGAGPLAAGPATANLAGFNAAESSSDMNQSLAGFNHSVTTSPLLPAGPGANQGRDIRGIPGGSLGNPLATLPPPGNHAFGTSVAGSPPGAPALPPQPTATDPRLPNELTRPGGSLSPALSNPVGASSPAVALAATSLPPTGGGLPSLGTSLPALGARLPAPGSGLPAPGSGLPAPGSGLPALAAGLPAPGSTGTGFRPSVSWVRRTGTGNESDVSGSRPTAVGFTGIGDLPEHGRNWGGPPGRSDGRTSRRWFGVPPGIDGRINIGGRCPAVTGGGSRNGLGARRRSLPTDEPWTISGSASLA
jgi:hypothetical protein